MEGWRYGDVPCSAAMTMAVCRGVVRMMTHRRHTSKTRDEQRCHLRRVAAVVCRVSDGYADHSCVIGWLCRLLVCVCGFGGCADCLYVSCVGRLCRLLVRVVCRTAVPTACVCRVSGSCAGCASSARSARRKTTTRSTISSTRRRRRRGRRRRTRATRAVPVVAARSRGLMRYGES